MIEQQIRKKQANLIAIVLNALLFLIAICECFQGGLISKYSLINTSCLMLQFEEQKIPSK